MAELNDPFTGDVIPALIKLIEATAELAAIEGFDSVVNKLEEAVEELEKINYGLHSSVRAEQER